MAGRKVNKKEKPLAGWGDNAPKGFKIIELYGKEGASVKMARLPATSAAGETSPGVNRRDAAITVAFGASQANENIDYFLWRHRLIQTNI